jgi:hypothetical protein
VNCASMGKSALRLLITGDGWLMEQIPVVD